MSEQKHKIKRQIIELHVQQNGADARQLQTEISRIYHRRIVPLIDQYCSEFSSPDRIHRIDSLEIDLGQINPAYFEAEIVSKFRSEIKKALPTQINQQEQTDKRQQGSPKTQSQLELLSQFARTGTIPWWADAAQTHLLHDCLQYLLTTSATELRALITQFVREQRPLRRLIIHFNDQELLPLVNLFQPSHSQVPAPFVLALQKTKPAASRQIVWDTLFQVAATNQDQPLQKEQTVTAVLKRIAPKLNSSYAQLLADIRQQVQSDKKESELYNLIESVSQEDKTAQTKQSKKPDKQKQKPDPLKQPDLEELYVENAGLVILWPFLNHFFNHLNMLHEKQFKDGQAQQKAIGLLQFIATEETEFPEFLLPLNKILCGSDLLDVFDMIAPLSEIEIEECTNLLTAVIAQAPILRSMSIDGFRPTFLQREGVLRSRDGAWLLQVEHLTHDIVLDRFPWSWEWVKLPWMDTALRVEW